MYLQYNKYSDSVMQCPIEIIHNKKDFVCFVCTRMRKEGWTPDSSWLVWMKILNTLRVHTYTTIDRDTLYRIRLLYNIVKNAIAGHIWECGRGMCKGCVRLGGDEGECIL